jgi:hypothetical protein
MIAAVLDKKRFAFFYNKLKVCVEQRPSTIQGMRIGWHMPWVRGCRTERARLQKPQSTLGEYA